MAGAIFDRKAPKRATNVSINADLLRQAKELGLNLSQALEERLEQIVREERRRRWAEEHRDALLAYRRFHERYGSVADEFNPLIRDEPV